MQENIARPKRAIGELGRGIMTVRDDLYMEIETTGCVWAKT